MEAMQFIRTGLTVKYMVADRVEDILPKLEAAALTVSRAVKEGAPETLEKF